jgi:hypothetical protein
MACVIATIITVRKAERDRGHATYLRDRHDRIDRDNTENQYNSEIDRLLEKQCKWAFHYLQRRGVDTRQFSMLANSGPELPCSFETTYCNVVIAMSPTALSRP